MGRLVHQTGEDQWSYEIYTPDTPAEELGGFAAFKKLWDDKRKGNGLPAWRDFELEDFADWYGWISVDDIIPGPTYDSVFRLWGTNLTQFYGKDLTNRRMSEFVGDFFSSEDFDDLQTQLGGHNFRICRGPVTWESPDGWRLPDWFSDIELPLADDGFTVDRYLNLTIVGEQK